MGNFLSDYNNGCHLDILKAFEKYNDVRTPGYGDDKFSSQAKQKIKEAFNLKNSDIYLLTGGTQTNQIVIDTMLKPYEGVLAATTGHINVHESGAIEYTGHKILSLPSHEGKIYPKDLEKYLDEFSKNTAPEHVVYPGMVYVSFPTEEGTIYSKEELESIYKICKKNKLTFFIDGARLGYGLASSDNNIKPQDLQNLCDVFYIGGTKQGLLIGEALIFTHKNMPEHFTYLVKRHGALLAKGRILGIQFLEMFKDGLYFKLSEHAITMADHVRKIFSKNKISFYNKNKTNQIFVYLNAKQYTMLSKKHQFEVWCEIDKNLLLCRFVTSWATTEEEVKDLEETFK